MEPAPARFTKAPEKGKEEHMTKLTDIKLKRPLTDVKPSEDKNDVLILPENCAGIVIQFLDAYGIENTRIDNPMLYPKEEIDKWLTKYCEPLWYDSAEEIREFIGVSAIIAPLDAEDLYQWSLQVLGMNLDSAYKAYLDERSREAEEYYQKYIKED